MTKLKKTFLWIGVIGGLPGGFYFLSATVFYAWMNAADPSRWPPERAGLWAGGSFLLTLVFLFYFGYSVFSLIRESNRKYSDATSET